MATYKELCDDFVLEMSINGGRGFSSAANANVKFQKAAKYIRDANTMICTLHLDWKFLWGQYSLPLTVGNRVIPSITDVKIRNWVKDSFWLDRGTTARRHLTYVPYEEWRQRPLLDASRKPASFTILPDNSVQVDVLPDSAYALTAEYHKRHTPFSDDADVSPIPEEYHRVISLRAKLLYGELEDAPEITNGALAEYSELIEKLEQDQWIAVGGEGYDSEQMRVTTA